MEKLVKQKRLLTDNLRKSHKRFLTTVTYKISLSTLCWFIPFLVSWANINQRDTCKCIVNANMQLIIAKLYENKTLLYHNIPKLLVAVHVILTV